MAEYIGRKIAVGAAREAVRGTNQVTPQFWFRILAQNHKDKAEYLKSLGSIGEINEFAHAEIDSQMAEGGFDAEIETESIGLILLALMGAVTSATAGDGYLHEFELDSDTASHPSHTLFIDEPGRNVAYPLGCLNSLSLNFERGKILDFSANFMSQKAETQALTPAFTELKAFRPKDFHLYFADDIDGLDAASETLVRTFSLEFNKNLEADQVLGVESPENFLNKVFGVTASMNLLYKDETFRSLFLAGTPKALRIKLLNPNHEITAAIAATGGFTIVDYTSLSGATVTVGGTVLTEGVEWNAGGSNNAAATSLASAINALTPVNATPSSATVNIVAATAGTAGNAITLAKSAADGVMTRTGATLSGGAAAINHYLVFDFARAYFEVLDEQNGRDELKASDVTLAFTSNPEEATIQFMQIRLLNETADYAA